MSFLLFLLCFITIVIIGTLVVSGWFFITRGDEQQMEDGSVYRYGKLFKGWYFFWMQKKDTKERIFYNDKNLRDLFYKIRHSFAIPNYNSLITQPMYALELKGDAFLIHNKEGYDHVINEIEYTYGIKFFDKGHGFYKVYKEYDEYVFPELIRTPLASCATCFSSIYGSLFYWLLIALLKVNLFEWSNYPAFASVFFWVCFCFSLSVTNTAVAKKYN